MMARRRPLQDLRRRGRRLRARRRLRRGRAQAAVATRWRDGDRILAVIRGTAVNQDGRSSGLTAPNGPAQEAVIRAALAAAGVAPARRRLRRGARHRHAARRSDRGAARSARRSRDGPRRPRPLAIGSVKTNIGHLEAAAGIAGLIKVVLALQHGEIPPHLHFADAATRTSTGPTLPVDVPTRATPWPPTAAARIAGVSSFGFSGTNAHVIARGGAAPRPRAAEPAASAPLHVLRAVGARARRRCASWPRRYARGSAATPRAALADVCFTANAGRAHFAHRAGRGRARRAAELRDAPARARGRRASRPASPRAAATARRAARSRSCSPGRARSTPAWAAAVRDRSPVFRARARRVRGRRSTRMLDRPLLESMLVRRRRRRRRIDETRYAQPALFAVEYALAALWRSWGVEPAAVLGHSVGEYAAACVAGVLSLEDARAAGRRARPR